MPNLSSEGTTSLVKDASNRYNPSLYAPGTGFWWAPRAVSYETLLASAARTATPTIATFDNPDYRGAYLVLYISAGTPSLTLALKAVDPLSAQSWTVKATGAGAVNATGVWIIRCYPGINAASGLYTGATDIGVSDALGPQYTAAVTHGNGNSITYTLGTLLLR